MFKRPKHILSSCSEFEGVCIAEPGEAFGKLYTDNPNERRYAVKLPGSDADFAFNEEKEPKGEAVFCGVTA